MPRFASVSAQKNIRGLLGPNRVHILAAKPKGPVVLRTLVPRELGCVSLMTVG